MNIDLTFIVDPYVVAGNMVNRIVRCPKHMKKVKPYKTYGQFVWKYYPKTFQLLRTGILTKELLDKYDNYNNLIKDLMAQEFFKNDIKRLRKLHPTIKKELENNYVKVIKYFKDVLKEPFETKQTVYLNLVGGRNLGDGYIEWGIDKLHRFKNYSTVYLVHEVLHSLFKRNNVTHAIIELIADNELRVRLNKPLSKKQRYLTPSNRSMEGHPWLDELRLQILPHWIKYLAGKTKYKNISAFTKAMEKKYL